MKITEHLLQGEGVTFADTNNKGGPITPLYLVIHYTAGRDGESSVQHFRDPSANASTHLVIGRDGRIWQLVPFNRMAWHTGVSAWGGLQGMNSSTIGIELDNAGKLFAVGDKYQAW